MFTWTRLCLLLQLVALVAHAYRPTSAFVGSRPVVLRQTNQARASSTTALSMALTMPRRTSSDSSSSSLWYEEAGNPISRRRRPRYLDDDFPAVEAQDDYAEVLFGRTRPRNAPFDGVKSYDFSAADGSVLVAPSGRRKSKLKRAAKWALKGLRRSN